MKSRTPTKPSKIVILKTPVSQSNRVTKKQKQQEKESPNFSCSFSGHVYHWPSGDTKNFIVHKEVACYHSTVFDAAFNSGFVEGQTQTYHLDDTTERAFRLLVQWMYFQKLELLQLKPGKLPKVDSGDAKKARADEDRSLVELWVLADKLDMPHLQNLALEKMENISKKTNKIASFTFKYVYNNTSTESQLRKYLVKDCATRLKASSFTKYENNFTHKMLIDIITYQVTSQKKGTEESNRYRPLSDFFVPVEED